MGDFGQPQPLDSADRQRYHHRQLSADAPELRLGLPQQGRWLGADRRLAYVRDRSADFSPGQTCGCTGMSGWLRSLFDQALTDRMGWHKNSSRWAFY